MQIDRGTKLEARTAYNEWVAMVAIDRPTRGKDFPVVWVKEPHQPDTMALPWPLDAVREPEET